MIGIETQHTIGKEKKQTNEVNKWGQYTAFNDEQTPYLIIL